MEDSFDYRDFREDHPNVHYIFLSGAKPSLVFIVEPPVFVQCLQRIDAKTLETATSRFEDTLPVLDIESTCIARGYPIPKVYCFIKETKMLGKLFIRFAVKILHKSQCPLEL